MPGPYCSRCGRLRSFGARDIKKGMRKCRCRRRSAPDKKKKPR